MSGVDPGVQANIDGYATRAAFYESIHPEIFNPREQSRAAAAIATAAAAISSNGTRALDFGCGSGNLARHMRQRGLDVTCADVSPEFLKIVSEGLGFPTIELEGGSTQPVPNAAFDLIGLYSVLHHIPDYLATVGELVHKLKPGGVMLVDHERNRSHWFPTPELLSFRMEMRASQARGLWSPDYRRWQHVLRAALSPTRHAARYRRLRKINAEGDIHVYRDDHLDWDAIVDVALRGGCELVERRNYLLFYPDYDEEIWHKWDGIAYDMTTVVVRRTVNSGLAT